MAEQVRNIIHEDFRKDGLSPEAVAWARHASHYHPPATDAVREAHRLIAEACEASLVAILERCPPSADRTHALNHVRQARMWANSAIALE